MPTNETNATPAVKTQQQQINRPDNNAISMMDLLHICIDNWKWFLLSLAVVMSLMVFHILRTVPVYTRSSEILLKQDEKGNNVAGDATAVLADMGLAQSATNITNEVYTLKSPALLLEVIKRLNLDMNYQVNGSFHKKTLYGASLPVTVSLPGLSDTDGATFTLELKGEGKYKISDIVYNGDEVDNTYEGILGQTIKTKLGGLKVTPNKSFDNTMKGKIFVSRYPLHNATRGCLASLSVSQADKNATIISLAYRDVSRKRAEDILNTLVDVYNENWVKEKNQVAVSTSQFIAERLDVIEKELGNVDDDISSYKSANLITDVKASSALAMQQAGEADKNMMELNNQLYMAKFIRNYLGNDANKFQLLPSNSGIGSSSVESMIKTYNDQLLQRNSLVANSSVNNPLVVSADQALASQRQAVARSIDNVIETLNAQIKSLKNYEGKANSQLASSPVQAKHLLSVERQQKVKEALYLFLLQKREENELTQAFTAYNTRVINPASGSNIPTSPVKSKLMLIAFALGLAIPFGIIYLRESTNTRIRGRRDIDGKTTMPFVGEIPYYGKKQPKWKFWVKREADDATKIAVKEGSRNIINEAFRVLRTNIEFMLNNKADENVMTITSYNPGSGKSFLTMNLAVSFAIKRKKVLVIDGDLRHGSASQYVDSPKTGLSNFLNNNVQDISSIAVNHPKYKMLDVLPIGTIPPNPTELLFSPRFEEVIKWARENYDYVFIDCPPADIVADTAIIEKHSDRTFFIIRAGLLERNMLEQLESDYKDEKFKNMSLILNGTESNGGRYRYQYGYKYGYHSYGYYGSEKE